MHLANFHPRLFLLSALLIIAISAILYHFRANHPVLYYYGASPEEVPQGRAIAVLNPLRNRSDEKNAEWLIRDLRTDRCEKIARDMLADPLRVCSTMRGNRKAILIWLDPESDTIKGVPRKLVYDLPDKQARLIVWFGPDESGWLVKTFSVVR
jgi:hypothetical protein